MDDLIMQMRKAAKDMQMGVSSPGHAALMQKAADALEARRDRHPPAADGKNIFRDVLGFIGRFSTDGWGEREEVIDCFTRGCCYWFAFILEARFREQYGAHIVTDYAANHFATMIGGRAYDITGDVTEGHTWEPWAACTDAALRRRIMEDCIMF